MTTKIDGRKFELLTKWYLRFNGYFTVDNFIIHAANDPGRISNGTIGNYSDIDVLGIRMPFHFERTGELEIKNDNRLDCIDKIDIVIAECKTGNQNSVNKIWTGKNVQAAEYLIRFCGIFKEDYEIKRSATSLIDHLKYEDDKYRIRIILFTQKDPSIELRNKGLNYISLTNILNFIIGERGECWVVNNLGDKSIHDSWDSLIKDFFKVANDKTKSLNDKKKEIYKILS